MLSLQRLHHGLSVCTNSVGENTTRLTLSIASRVSAVLPTTVTKHSMKLYTMLPLNLIIAAAALSPTISANCSDQFVATLTHGLGMIINILMGLGVAVAVIGIVIGGLMRATAWGSEQKVAMSNKAITAAVIGLVIVLLGVTLGSQVPTWFGNANGSCTTFNS
jgi:hypothetical protein